MQVIVVSEKWMPCRLFDAAVVKQIEFWAHSILFAAKVDIGPEMIFVRNETEREQGVGIVNRKETDAIETFTDTLALNI